MRKITVLLLVLLSFEGLGQEYNKKAYLQYDKITEIEGTDYVYIGVTDGGKKGPVDKYMQFVNTVTGESTLVVFPDDGLIHDVTQVKIDSLDINILLVMAKTVNMNGDKKGIDWNDPKQLIMLSTDGKKKVQATVDNYYVQYWKVIRRTGAIVITGYYDNNKNKTYDSEDKSEVLTFNLKTMSRLGKDTN